MSTTSERSELRATTKCTIEINTRKAAHMRTVEEYKFTYSSNMLEIRVREVASTSQQCAITITDPD